jgi:hypothetical protein
VRPRDIVPLTVERPWKVYATPYKKNMGLLRVEIDILVPGLQPQPSHSMLKKLMGRLQHELALAYSPEEWE